MPTAEERNYFEDKIKQDENYYSILGIEKTATEPEIKAAYRKLARKYHPDKVTKEKEKDAQEIMQKLNEAIDTLFDPEKRNKYDQDQFGQRLFSKDGQIDPEKKDKLEKIKKFESLTRKVLDIINPLKRNITISSSIKSFTVIGEVGRRPTGSLNDTERKYFINFINLLGKAMPSKATDEEKSPLGKVIGKIEERRNETTYPGSDGRSYSSLRYNFESIENIISLIADREEEVEKLLTEYKKAIEYITFFNKKRRESLLKAEMHISESGEIKISLEEDYSKKPYYSYEEEDDKEYEKARDKWEIKFKEELQDEKSSFPGGKINSRATLRRKIETLLIEPKDFIKKYEQKEIDEFIENYNKERQLEYKILILNSYIKFNDAEGVKESLEALKKDGIDLSNLEQITKEMRIPFPLWHATESRSGLEIFKLLTENELNIRYENTNRNGTASIFYSACKYCELDVVQYLYNKLGNPDLNKIKGYFGETPLHGAIRKMEEASPILAALTEPMRKDSIKKIKFLVKNGADLNQKNTYGKKPIEVSISENKELIGLAIAEEIGAEEDEKEELKHKLNLSKQLKEEEQRIKNTTLNITLIFYKIAASQELKILIKRDLAEEKGVLEKVLGQEIYNDTVTLKNIFDLASLILIEPEDRDDVTDEFKLTKSALSDQYLLSSNWHHFEGAITKKLSDISQDQEKIELLLSSIESFNTTTWGNEELQFFPTAIAENKINRIIERVKELLKVAEKVIDDSTQEIKETLEQNPKDQEETSAKERPDETTSEAPFGKSATTEMPEESPITPPAPQEPKTYTQKSPESLKKRALDLIEGRKFSEAINLYDELLKITDPRNAEDTSYVKSMKLLCYAYDGKIQSEAAKDLFNFLEKVDISQFYPDLQNLISGAIDQYKKSTIPLKRITNYEAASVPDILASATFSDANPEIRTRTFEIYKELWEIQSLQPLMIAMSYAARGFYQEKGSKLKIIASENSIENSELNGAIGGLYNAEHNVIYFNVGGGSHGIKKDQPYQKYSNQMLKGFLIHEMYHAWENFKHQNECRPYSKGSDRSKIEEIKQEVAIANGAITCDFRSTNADTLPFGIFDISHYDDKSKDAELVVRTPHAIAALTGMTDAKSEKKIEEKDAIAKIKNLFPKSFSFFEKELKEIKDWNKAIENRFSVKPLSPQEYPKTSLAEKTPTEAESTTTQTEDTEPRGKTTAATKLSEASEKKPPIAPTPPQEPMTTEPIKTTLTEKPSASPSPTEHISLQKQAEAFNAFNKDELPDPANKYSEERISTLKKSFEREKIKINRNIPDSEFFTPKKYSGIGAKTKCYYIGTPGIDGRWKFDIEEVFENSPASKLGLKAGGSLEFRGEKDSLKLIIQNIRNGEIKIDQKSQSETRSIFEFNKQTQKYELFNFEKDIQKGISIA